MAAAYAALVSLLNTMDQIHNHPRLFTSFDNHQFESLHEKVDFLLDFVENCSDADSTEEAEDLVGRIAFVAHVSEDIIERQVADRIGGGSIEKSSSFLGDLQKKIEDMESIKENVIKVKEERGFKDQQPTSSMPTSPSSSAPPATAETATMVGFDGYLVQLLDQLTGHNSGRQILSIIGMGGIGKTTLARNLYQNSLILYHFDVRAWVTVSQEYNAREILLQALSYLGGSTIEMDKTDNELGEELYKTLSGRRYLIVLDDVYSVEAWEKIMFFFPENDSRSRIVITTRQSKVVDYFGSSAIAVEFLDDKNSWDLFCDKTFAGDGCPPELEVVGKKIVGKCKGLPLAIVVIGGLLGKSYRTREYWEKIANDISLILNSGEGNQLLSILSLSYKHLPVHLKSCFLYLGLFPEDYEIDVSQLIKLWIAEGFIKSNANQSLEEIAESYVKELVDRKLLLVRYLRLSKKIGTCCVHDLVRDMCVKIAEKENFYCVERDIDGRRHFIVDERMSRFYPRQSHTPETPWRHRLLGLLRRLDYTFREVYLRFLFHESPHVEFHSSLTRSLVRRHESHSQRPASLRSRLLRVLDIHDMGCLEGSFREVNLRFLYHSYSFGFEKSFHTLPSSISQLWSLQTLIIERALLTFIAPHEIWKMPQLRHIEMSSIYLLDPPPPSDDDVFVLQNLQTLKRAHNLMFTKELCKRIPNIKEMDIEYSHLKQGEASLCNYHLQNIGSLNKLESLRYSWYEWEYGGDSLQNLKLPSSLKELTLEKCCLDWSDAALIGSLPHLEVLELLGNAVVGVQSDSVEEQCLCLKHLRIEGRDDQIHWIANNSSLPVLETLSLEYLSELDEIPSCFGEIPTLERMEMYHCSDSAAMSAVKILEEQESLGNEGLQLHLKFYDKIEAAMWKEKIQQLGFTSQNLQISLVQWDINRARKAPREGSKFWRNR